MTGPWYKDDLALRLLGQALTPEQVIQMKGMSISKLGFAREQIELNILTQTRVSLF
jgi:hypothetical protein